jgi:4-hydroxybenzoate polyprenyltransferase
MEIGILPTLFVLAVLLLMVWTLRRQRGRLGDPFFEAINIAAQASWLGALVAFSFLPLMQDLQLLGYLWVVAAIPLVALREGSTLQVDRKSPFGELRANEGVFRSA